MTTLIDSGEAGRLRRLRRALSPAEWRRTGAMLSSIVGLHVVAVGGFVLFVLPLHHRGLGLGIGVTAYTLGLRHAFDADHISAIDNTTRKLMSEGQRPLSVGYFFSLGHSSVVVAIGVGLVVAEKSVYAAVSTNGSTLEQFGGVFGTVVSAAFLYLIAVLNLVVVAGIFKVFKRMRHGELDEQELEEQLNSRGFFFRFFGRWMRAITKPWQMYPVGVVFGMGFDTATEVALLLSVAILAKEDIPWYAVMCLPLLFTAGMSLLDTADGCFMNGAYGWAFLRPVRKVYYNLVITGLSVAICYFIGTIEVLGLGRQEFHWTDAFWSFMYDFNINTAGFVIVGMFVLTFVVAQLVWRYGHIEAKWNAGLRSGLGPHTGLGSAEGVEP